MAADLIRYDLLVQDALRGVVRKVLSDAARDGLAGDHHFYISFRTHARGVRLSSRMREAYPDEMTIVLQHQFWDLNVTDQAFEVGLSFKNIPEMLLIPFDAITRFSDPSAEFDLKFTLADELVETGANDKGFPHPQSASPLVFETSPPEQAPLLPPLGQENDAALSAGLEEAGDGAETAAQGEAKVVSIEAFRKKS
ncbi:hypothetical protein CU048_01555 [Beijerinckiaceae bacterium]|nr:hypothetical protein CU048_01555 [Beijerinckiaceae bacterium]